jgi:hypothetical protein
VEDSKREHNARTQNHENSCSQDALPILWVWRLHCTFPYFPALTSLTSPKQPLEREPPHRCGQPGQQQGRRIPLLSCEHTLSTCCRLVSSFLTEMVQQIHSLRASGVISSQAANAFASDASAVRRSVGRLCTTPSELGTVGIEPSRGLKD